jgi:DNA-binding CsgD family transcriptional regulator
MEPRAGQKPVLLSKAFGLAPAEARLASIIAEGLNPQRAAEVLGISHVTARNQLRRSLQRRVRIDKASWLRVSGSLDRTLASRSTAAA